MYNVEHIAIAVESIDESLFLYVEQLGFKLKGIETIEEQGVRTAILDAGNTKIELLEPVNENSSIKKYLIKKGEGLHHIAFKTEDIKKELKQLKDEGIKLIDNEPRKGAENKKIAFIHPKSVNSVLIELCE